MKTIILITALFVVLFIAACTPSECAGDDNCFFEKAISENNELQCNYIKNANIKQSCKVELAIMNDDAQKCVFLNSSYCLTSIAEKNQDIEVCKSIEDKRMHDICLKNLALNMSNSAICRQVIVDDARDDCYSELSKSTNQTELCYFIVDIRKRDICIAARAIKLTDSNYCYNIKDLTIKSICYLRIAQKSGKEKVCENIQVSGIKKDCLELVRKG
jgi:hypothetical protein